MLYSLLQVNTNGVISFDRSFSSYSTRAFPIDGASLVAPYWADIDTNRNDGRIYHRQVTGLHTCSSKQHVSSKLREERALKMRDRKMQDWKMQDLECKLNLPQFQIYFHKTCIFYCYNSYVNFMQKFLRTAEMPTVVGGVIRFLPRCMERRGGLAMRNLSVRLFVCPSNAFIVTKRNKDLSRFLYHTKDHSD